MASRKEQKARARAQRLEAERQAARRTARSKRVRATITALAVLAGAILIAVIAMSGGGAGNAPQSVASGKLPALPPVRTSDLAAAAKAAGCVVKSTDVGLEPRNRQHVGSGTTVHYVTNPPSYGPHYQTPASDGDYVGKAAPATGDLVHSLEHGRVEIQYQRGLPSAQLRRLEALFNENDGTYGPGQFLLLFQNTTGMPYAVAATAWDHVLGCSAFSPRIFDALRAFRLAFTLKGPEAISQPE